MDFWEKVKRDVQKGIREGLVFVREGVAVVREKAGELTGEGKRRIRIFELKTRVQKEVTELGGRVYSLDSQNKSPMKDTKVKTSIGRIRKLETQIAKLEGTLTPKPVAKQRKRFQKRKNT